MCRQKTHSHKGHTPIISTTCFQEKTWASFVDLARTSQQCTPKFLFHLSSTGLSTGRFVRDIAEPVLQNQHLSTVREHLTHSQKRNVSPSFSRLPERLSAGRKSADDSDLPGRSQTSTKGTMMLLMRCRLVM